MSAAAVRLIKLASARYFDQMLECLAFTLPPRLANAIAVTCPKSLP